MNGTVSAGVHTILFDGRGLHLSPAGGGVRGIQIHADPEVARRHEKEQEVMMQA